MGDTRGPVSGTSAPYPGQLAQPTTRRKHAVNKPQTSPKQAVNSGQTNGQQVGSGGGAGSKTSFFCSRPRVRDFAKGVSHASKDVTTTFVTFWAKVGSALLTDFGHVRYYPTVTTKRGSRRCKRPTLRPKPTMEVSTMSTLRSADSLGNPPISRAAPHTLATWQEDLERDLPYYTRYYKYRFRGLTPELREEMVQEATVQTAIMVANQYRNHGGRVEYRHLIGRYVAYFVKRGRSSTRQHGHNADPLDHSYRPTGAKRDPDSAIALEHVSADRELSDDFRLDLLGFIDSVTDTLREYALLAYRGASEATIAQTMGICQQTAGRYRRRLRRRHRLQQRPDSILRRWVGADPGRRRLGP